MFQRNLRAYVIWLAVGVLACDRVTERDARGTATDSLAVGKDMGFAGSPGAPQARRMEGRVAGAAREGSVPSTAIAMEMPSSPPAPPTPRTAPPADSAATMIIRTGEATIEVKSVDSAMAQVRALASRVGGFVANESVAGGRGQPRFAMLELRIPAARFDQAIAGLSPFGRVESVNIHSQDVGEEYVDLVARLANSRRLESRLIDLLTTRTGRLQDVLAVERELARVREEIERVEGRARYLRTRVATSTLVVHLREPRPILGNDPGDRPIRSAFRGAWQNFIGFIALLIRSLGVLIPLGAFAIVAWIVVRRVRHGAGARPE